MRFSFVVLCFVILYVNVAADFKIHFLATCNAYWMQVSKFVHTVY